MIANLKSFAARLSRDESGVTLLEYTILAGLIAVVAIVTITNVGLDVNRIFGIVQTDLDNIK